MPVNRHAEIGILIFLHLKNTTTEDMLRTQLGSLYEWGLTIITWHDFKQEHKQCIIHIKLPLKLEERMSRIKVSLIGLVTDTDEAALAYNAFIMLDYNDEPENQSFFRDKVSVLSEKGWKEILEYISWIQIKIPVTELM